MDIRAIRGRPRDFSAWFSHVFCFLAWVILMQVLELARPPAAAGGHGPNFVALSTSDHRSRGRVNVKTHPTLGIR